MKEAFAVTPLTSLSITFSSLDWWIDLLVLVWDLSLRIFALRFAFCFLVACEDHGLNWHRTDGICNELTSAAALANI